MSAVRRLRAVPDPAKTDFAEFTEGISNRFARCRGTNHWWDPYTVTPDRAKNPRSYEVVEKCDRCGSTRARILDSTGAVAKNGHRTYPDGYLATGVDMTNVGVGERKAAMRLRVISDTLTPANKRRKR